MTSLPEKHLTPQQIVDSFNELARRANRIDRWQVHNGKVVHVISSGRPLKVDASSTPYRINRDQLAQMVAAHASGFPDAIPEQIDYDFADDTLRRLEAHVGK